MHHTPKPRSVAYADATATFSWVVSEVRVRARVGVRALVRVSMGLDSGWAQARLRQGPSFAD